MHFSLTKEYSKEELKRAKESMDIRSCKIAKIALVLAFSFTLFSCSHASGNSIRIKSGASNVFSLNESFRDDVYEVVDKNGTVLAPVTSNIIKGFSTKQSQFDTDLSANVIYQGESLPFAYQISSSYEDSATGYQMIFDNQGTIKLTFIGKPDQRVTEFSLPENFSFLPSPLAIWPITSFAASFGGFSSSLKRVVLNPSLQYFTPLESDNLSSLEIVPSSAGKLHYDERGFLVVDSSLWGISSSFEGALDLPKSIATIEPSAFAGTLSEVTSLTADENFANPNFTMTSFHLPKNQAFIIHNNNHGYSSKNGFIFYTSGNDVLCRGIPAGLKCPENTLTLPTGINRFLLDALYGMDNPTMVKVVLPDSVTSFKDGISDLKNTTLHTLRLTSPTVVSTNSISVNNLPSSLTAIEVPSSLLSQYQGAAGWSLVKERFVAF